MTAAGSITTTSSGPTSCGWKLSQSFPACTICTAALHTYLYKLYTLPTSITVQKKYQPKLNVTYRTARDQGMTRTFTGSDSRGPCVQSDVSMLPNLSGPGPSYMIVKLQVGFQWPPLTARAPAARRQGRPGAQARASWLVELPAY